jgi:hypothetical protein
MVIQYARGGNFNNWLNNNFKNFNWSYKLILLVVLYRDFHIRNILFKGYLLLGYYKLYFRYGIKWRS